MASINSRLEPAIWLHDTGQWIPCFDRCQLTISWMSNIKVGCFKPRLHVSVNLLAGVWLLACVAGRRAREGKGGIGFGGEDEGTACKDAIVFFVFYVHQTNVKILIGQI